MICGLVVATLLIITIVSHFSSGNKRTSSGGINTEEIVTSENVSDQAPVINESICVGESVQNEGVEIVFVESGKIKKADVKDDEKCIYIKAAFVNEGLADYVVSAADFVAYADGKACEERYGEGVS